MPEQATTTSPPTSSLLERLPGVAAWTLEVDSTEHLTPSMCRVRLRGEGLASLHYESGQDVMVNVPTDTDQNFRRRYSIRYLDPTEEVLTLDICLHGDGPGARWAAGAVPGSTVEIIGPRGKVTLDPDADWHIFAGDEAALPAFSSMLEALAPGARAIALFEVGGADEVVEVAVPDGADVTIEWLGREGARPTGAAHRSARGGAAPRRPGPRLPLGRAAGHLGSARRPPRARPRTRAALPEALLAPRRGERRPRRTTEGLKSRSQGQPR